MRRTTLGIGLLAVAAASACDLDSGTSIELEEFRADLTGDNEVPPVETDAQGVAEFGWDGSTMFYGIGATTEITDVTAAHIHDENGDILVTLFSGSAVDLEAQEILVQGEFTMTDPSVDVTIGELLELMRSSDVYVNVHTELHPAGEIRGQIVPVQED